MADGLTERVGRHIDGKEYLYLIERQKGHVRLTEIEIKLTDNIKITFEIIYCW